MINLMDRPLANDHNSNQILLGFLGLVCAILEIKNLILYSRFAMENKLKWDLTHAIAVRVHQKTNK